MNEVLHWLSAPSEANGLAWPLMIPILLFGIVATWKGSRQFEQATEDLSHQLRLPPAVQGGVFAAVGSSAPELFSALLATFVHGAFELGVAAIVGSAIFNILVIPALATLFGGPQRTNSAAVRRDVRFYVVSIVVLLLTFALAVVYFPGPRVDDQTGTVTRGLALLPLATYGVYLFLQWRDSREGEDDRPSSAEAPSAALWPRLLVSLALIIVGVEAMLRGVLWLGNVSGSPAFLWSLIIVAGATSVPDAVVSIRAMTKQTTEAGKERGAEVSFSNVLGSNIFDLLVATPAGVLLAGTALINFSVAAPLMGVLFGATLFFAAALRFNRCFTRMDAWRMLALYGVFIVWVALETVGTTHLLALAG